MTEKVKSCPFCGGKEVKLFKEGSIWVVECLQCLAKVGATAEADVLDFWNARPIENELNEKIEKLEAENERLREALESILDAAQKDEPCIMAIKVVAYTALKGDKE